MMSVLVHADGVLPVIAGHRRYEIGMASQGRRSGGERIGISCPLTLANSALAAATHTHTPLLRCPPPAAVVPGALCPP